MAMSEVSVFAPGTPDVLHCTGRTDSDGCFAFVPNQAGDWRFRVEDGQGHAVDAHMRVLGDSAEVVQPTPVLGRIRGSMIGVAAILGIFSMVALFSSWMGRRQGVREVLEESDHAHR